MKMVLRSISLEGYSGHATLQNNSNGSLQTLVNNEHTLLESSTIRQRDEQVKWDETSEDEIMSMYGHICSDKDAGK